MCVWGGGGGGGGRAQSREGEVEFSCHLDTLEFETYGEINIDMSLF